MSTAGGIIAAAQALVTQLQNLSASVGGDVMIATNNAGTQISAATDHLNTVLHDQLNVPLTQLDGNLRNQALLLSSMVTQVNLLLDRQRACLFSQADLFVAGLNTAVATLKKGVPFVSAGGATVTSFQFDGLNTPNVVPRNGGALVVKGFDVWGDQLAPKVSITTLDGKAVATPSATRAQDDNSYRISIDPGVISQNAGSCLYVDTVPRTRKRFLGIPLPGSANDEATLVLPMCIPQTMTTKVRLSAHITYDQPQPDQHALDPYQNFRFDNSDCNHTHAVSMTKGWALPDGYSILSVDSKQVELRNNNNNIQFSFNGSTITAAGTQDSPTCISIHIPLAPSIDKLDHSAIWSYDARPVISGTMFVAKDSTASSDAVNVVIPVTQLCASLAKLANAKGRKTSISYTITPIVNGKEFPSFSSPVYTTDDATNTFALPPATAFEGEFTLGGQYNPNPVGGNCQACVTLAALKTCAF
jgi:hypothetical protein